MEHFFNCIEEKVIQLLETSKFTIVEEFEETGARADDHLIIKKINETISLLRCRIDRSGDRCSEKDCIRRAGRFDSEGRPKCKYH